MSKWRKMKNFRLTSGQALLEVGYFFVVVIFPREPIASVVSPRTKKELREDDEWGEGNKCNYVNGHSYGTFGNGITTNGAKKNGDYKRNGEVRSSQLFDTIKIRIAIIRFPKARK